MSWAGNAHRSTIPLPVDAVDFITVTTMHDIAGIHRIKLRIRVMKKARKFRKRYGKFVYLDIARIFAHLIRFLQLLLQ